jgi:hypothetical protein
VLGMVLGKATNLNKTQRTDLVTVDFLESVLKFGVNRELPVFEMIPLVN